MRLTAVGCEVRGWIMKSFIKYKSIFDYTLNMTKCHIRDFNKKKNITLMYILKNLICGEISLRLAMELQLSIQKKNYIYYIVANSW